MSTGNTGQSGGDAFDKLFKVGVIVALLCLAFKLNVAQPGPGPGPGPGPEPTPAINVEAAAKQATIHYAVHLAQAMDQVAGGVESGSIKTADQLKNEVQKLTETARIQAFAIDEADGGLSLGEIDNQFIPYEQFDESNRAKVSNYLKLKAKGHGSVK